MPSSNQEDFRLNQSGGAILEVKQTLNAKKILEEVYLTVGDFIKLGYSGVQISNSARSILGSLLRVRSDGTTLVVANGFRNPQGIGYFETSNKTQIFQSEHGPRGGDEINEIIEGNFYGWPDFSFGTQYAPNQPQHSPEASNTSGTSFEPLFSWLPSIGPSKVHQVKSSVLRRYWADSSNGSFGDVLVAGMGSQALYRLRILDSKVVYSEAIYLGFRIRSLVETESGEFVFGTDSGIRSLTPSQIWGGPLGTFIDLSQINP
jgi:glucose/arabinose dehydrogenase